GAGTAWDGQGVRPPHPVLVVRSLDPALAPLLPGLAGLVAETGSVLSHLAVLAREYHVPTVVGVPDAVGRFGPGTGLVVDGGTGAVELTGAAPEGEAAGPREGPADTPGAAAAPTVSGGPALPGVSGAPGGHEEPGRRDENEDAARDEPRKGAVA
ncbi:PEP-utilizing enzyme, partial [Actinacidiphila alni]|uniref:PEP-utilizing enzyme n=1 Tax=Actinacidiphila alni TaxID=380248 RepID=UPI0033E50AC5